MAFEEKLEMTLGHTEFKWQILGLAYETSEWVKLNISLKNRWFDYQMVDAEFIDIGGIERLREMLWLLYDGKITEVTESGFFEPDIRFIYYPEHVVPNAVKRDGGKVIEDIWVQMVIKHFDHGMTYSDEEYRFPFFRDDIVCLVAYLDKVLPQLQLQWDEYEPKRKEVGE